ncbi:hypothetical protein BKA63DRAFT_414367 [Paraphoma chrysanthemicola]|nr:hypothetical protein BKA63DRAFT_414367 [Paraphoma chrysanthemicola]
MDNLTRKQRRQRAILSCNDCRRRKLKCDRLSPCNRCIKGGITDSCAYGVDVHTIAPEGDQNGPRKKQRTYSARPRRSTDEQGSIGPYSESDVFNEGGSMEPGSAAQPDLDPLKRGDIDFREHLSGEEQQRKDQVEFLAKSPELKATTDVTTTMVMLKGRSFGTHFYGPTAAMSVVAHFPDLRLFMKEAYGQSTARRLSQDIKASEDRVRSLRAQHRIFRIGRLRDLLPDRQIVDVLLRRYFETYETTYRVIHVPTFNEAYASYWTSHNTEDVEMDALILAMLACSICTSVIESPRYNHIGSTFHSRSVLWLRACEAWLKRQSNKRRSLASLQVRCLRLLALATSSIKVKEYYQEVQAYVALLRSAGLHRDPSIFGTRCSVFEGEMRRRLWATAMELELQASIDKGTSSILVLEHDCAPPRNVNDVELYPSLEVIPKSRSNNIFTDTSFLHSSMQSIGLRTSLCAQVNSLKGGSELHETMRSEDDVRTALKDIPRWTDPRSGQARNLLDLQLRQFLVVLYAPRALKPESSTVSDSRYSMFTSLEAASKTLEVHNNLVEASNFALVLTRNDYFRAMLLICHVTYHARRASDSIMLRLAKQVFEDCVDKSLRLQEERASRTGRGSEFYWYISAAVSLVRKQFQPSQTETMQRQAIDRVAKLLHKFLSLQDEPDEKTLATEVILGETPNATMPIDVALHAYNEPPTIDDFSSAGLSLDAFGDGLGDTPAWMDDLWFFNVPPLDFNGQSHSTY